MKRSRISIMIILAVAVVGMSLMPDGTALADHRIKIPYVTQNANWFTGIAITNMTNSAVTLYADFVHKDGSYSTAVDRVNLGEFTGYEMKIFSLEDLYNVDKDPAVPLPGDSFMLWITHWADAEPFGAAVFISNNLPGIGGYGFQQFYSESF